MSRPYALTCVPVNTTISGTDQRGIVIGVAIVRHGQVLSARRTKPSATAGGWEFPGGKVEAGETIEAAAVREIDEELGCRVDIGRPLAGETVLPSGQVLRILLGTLVDCDPSPHDHDALRWLGPEELREVPWLPADEPFLAELEQLLLDGDRFTGGNVGGATRIGMTVRRPRGSWSEPVHRLLAHLRAAGLDGVPEVLGVDARGREILTYFPGYSLHSDEQMASDQLLADGIGWVGRFHAAVRDFRPAGAIAWRNGTRALGGDEIICHHDAGAYNWAIVDDHVVGVLDWDMAGPGRPIEDLAFIAWNTLPLYRPIPTDDVVRRLDLMARAYGDPDVDAMAIISAVETRMDGAIAKIEDGQRRGDPGMLNLLEVDEPNRTRRRMVDLRERIPLIQAELARRTAS